MLKVFKATGTRRVFVYRNLHNGMWSVRAVGGMNDRRVIMHARHVKLHGAAFHVSLSGRERVITERRKNVHAGIYGDVEYVVSEGLRYDEPWDVSDNVEVHMIDSASAERQWRSITYNPYSAPYFVYRGTSTQAVVGFLSEIHMHSDMRVTMT